MSVYLIPLIAPALLAIVAIAARTTPGYPTDRLARASEWAALAAVTSSAAGLVALLIKGPGSAGLIAAGLSVRIDALTVTMSLLVSFVGWVVLRYSGTYLRGEKDQNRFTGLICATVASVLLFVQSGGLTVLVVTWIATSLFLHQLLIFCKDRTAATRAAFKKSVTARLSDAALIAATALLAGYYGTADIAGILSKAQAGSGAPELYAVAALLAIAAVLKSAQFPFHGWLTEVMETPTPVSALLHAGVINAGGFLLIRFADVMLLAPAILAFLVLIGGFTALLAGLVMLTQPAIKTSLAWSTIAQMGFMVLQCGLALFPIALLHIVAHSLYKAHAFLSSGTAVDAVTAARKPGPVAIPGPRAVLLAFTVALTIYGTLAILFGFSGKSPQALALGAILIFGVAYLLAQGFADRAPVQLTRRTTLYALGASLSYFALQAAADAIYAGTLPLAPVPGALEWMLIALALISFGTVAVAQSMFAHWANIPAIAGLRVHIANGFYANALTDRLLKTRSLTKLS
ncbi:proton-conducting transporter membrane subunit [uncultured Roseobacter sp.]|uniref:proton-conducting transporter transmembrane domain-containing protein n=1 Tax=uncultured Roseobacter sp. TaxID=114847 RepID=UPI00262BEDFA|nr:proton-conducting transporter membrane subunit [uncultured Roseobacter sp.]